jgi:hypothetical protein
MRKHTAFITLALAALSAFGDDNKPNIIFILADDFGCGEAGCYNPESKIPTPNLWLIYYGPDTYFDWPECDIRVAICEGKLEDLKSLAE